MLNWKEDIYRTLPFSGTALAIVIAAIGYAAGRLTPWGELPGHGLFLTSSGAAPPGGGLVDRRDHSPVTGARSPELPANRARERAPRAAGRAEGLLRRPDKQPPDCDALIARDFQVALIASYERVMPVNWNLNGKPLPLPGTGGLPPREKLALSAWGHYYHLRVGQNRTSTEDEPMIIHQEPLAVEAPKKVEPSTDKRRPTARKPSTA